VKGQNLSAGFVVERSESMKTGRGEIIRLSKAFIQIGLIKISLPLKDYLTELLKNLMSSNNLRKNNVRAIFNLEEPGEHPSCGDGIVDMKVGFSYTPEKLQSHGISVYLFHWKDLTNPRFIDLIKNITFMDYHINKGEKVLVHCHAGQGRTALVIAAYLMYKNTTKTVEDTIKYIRKERPQ